MFNRIVFFWKIGCLGALLGLANWYVYKEALPAAVSYAALIPFLVLPFCFSLAYNAIHSVPVSIAKLFSWTGGFWFIFTIYATKGSCVYAVLYLLGLFLGYDPLWQTYHGHLALVLLLLVLAIMARGIYKAVHPVIRHVVIQTKKAVTPVRLAFLTDIHMGPLQSHWYTRRLVRRVMALQPDAVLFGGDLIDAHLGFVLRDGSYQQLKQLQAPYGIWAVFGNHDFYDGDIDTEEQALAPIHFLRHQQEFLAPGIILTGLNDYIHFPSETIPDCDTSRFNIIMDHEPLRIREAAKKGYDLYLGGHTHGGQFFPVTWITDRMYLLNYGSRRIDSIDAVVSSGYGSWGFPFRTGPSPEIVMIEINRTRGR